METVWKPSGTGAEIKAVQHEMKDSTDELFISLFRQAYEKCFGHDLSAPISESDSKLFSNTILEKTGLMIGVKSIKNYSWYVLNSHETKKENPSIATLDTLARYVLNAPYTNEIQRKNTEGHHPYWYQYRKRYSQPGSVQAAPPLSPRKKTGALIVAGVGLLLIAIWATMQVKPKGESSGYDVREDFSHVDGDSLFQNGWSIKNLDTQWWEKRTAKTGHLTLHTLPGDNWSTPDSSAAIRNLLVRSVPADCFTTEIHFSEFVPENNWQQAGILLSEDSTFSSKVIRISLSYNDFFGGFEKPPEILVQIISSIENGVMSKPEEVAHLTLFSVDADKTDLIKKNLKESALKIEKKGNHLRFLYMASPVESFAFKEVTHGDFNFQPAYIGIFAIQGVAPTEEVIPVFVTDFSLFSVPCTDE